jgi:hypothetical protein
MNWLACFDKAVSSPSVLPIVAQACHALLCQYNYVLQASETDFSFLMVVVSCEKAVQVLSLIELPKILMRVYGGLRE